MSNVSLSMNKTGCPNYENTEYKNHKSIEYYPLTMYWVKTT